MKQMTTLPVLVLSYPRVLFPTARLIFPVDQPTTLAIQELLHKNPDERPHVLAIPALATLEGADIQLAEMGVVARVARVVKMPTVRGNAFVHFVHLHGVGVRARFTDLFSLSPENVLRHAKITPIGDDKFPSNNFVEPFRSAALVLLGRLAADPAQSSRNGGWRKVREIIEDMTEPNVMHLADMLLSGLEVDHADKLGMFDLSSYYTAFLTSLPRILNWP
jgi:ATP-dependent Lon protease